MTDNYLQAAPPSSKLQQSSADGIDLLLEAKSLADEVTDGDIAALIDKGITALEQNDLPARGHGLPAWRTGYWATLFQPDDWAIVQECVLWLTGEGSDDDVVTAVMSEATPRAAAMNVALHRYARRTAAAPDNSALPEELLGEALKLTEHVRDVTEQSLRFYLGIIIASRYQTGTDAASHADAVGRYKKTQYTDTLGKLLTRKQVPDALSRRRQDLLDRGLAALRNAGAHPANINATDDKVLIHASSDNAEAPFEEWTLEQMRDVTDLMRRTTGALSVAVSIASCGRVLPPGEEGGGLSALERLLETWMEWSGVTASADGESVITVQARAPGAIRFGNLVHAAGGCPALVGHIADTLRCEVTPIDAAAVLPQITIEMPIPGPEDVPADADDSDYERMALEKAAKIKIDGKPFMILDADGKPLGPGDAPANYGGPVRMRQDRRFWAPPGDYEEETGYSGAPGIFRPVGIVNLWSNPSGRGLITPF